jgi:hypothetical protein
MPHLFDRLYRWDLGSRAWSRWRFLLVLLVLETPAILALIALRYCSGASDSLREMLAGVVLLSTAAMLGWGAYSLLRTLKAAWQGVRGRPYELQSWQEPE